MSQKKHILLNGICITLPKKVHMITVSRKMELNYGEIYGAC